MAGARPVRSRKLAIAGSFVAHKDLPIRSLVFEGSSAPRLAGRNLIAMQDYRAAVSERSQAELDRWLKAHPGGVPDDDGRIHIPETDLRRIDAANKRMTKRQRAQFQKKQFYATAA
jgi:hypothetical protein